jgi:hypothetical protein
MESTKKEKYIIFYVGFKMLKESSSIKLRFFLLILVNTKMQKIVLRTKKPCCRKEQSAPSNHATITDLKSDRNKNISASSGSCNEPDIPGQILA